MHLGLTGESARLPGVRELALEYEVNPRTVLSAYKQLEEEGLLDLRQRSGAYVVSREKKAADPASWLTDVLVDVVQRGMPAPDFSEHVHRALKTRRVQAAVLECNTDQISSISEELQRDYGIAPFAVDVETVGKDGLPIQLRQADLLVTTPYHASQVRRISKQSGVPSIALTMCTDLWAAVGRLLTAGPMYFVVTDPRFAGKLSAIFETSPGAKNLRVLVHGTDDLEAIPANAPTYVTKVTRRQLRGHRILQRGMPEARVFSKESCKDILAFLINSNRAERR